MFTHLNVRWRRWKLNEGESKRTDKIQCKIRFDKELPKFYFTPKVYGKDKARCCYLLAVFILAMSHHLSKYRKMSMPTTILKNDLPHELYHTYGRLLEMVMTAMQPSLWLCVNNQLIRRAFAKSSAFHILHLGVCLPYEISIFVA